MFYYCELSNNLMPICDVSNHRELSTEGVHSYICKRLNDIDIEEYFQPEATWRNDPALRKQHVPALFHSTLNKFTRNTNCFS